KGVRLEAVVVVEVRNLAAVVETGVGRRRRDQERDWRVRQAVQGVPAKALEIRLRVAVVRVAQDDGQQADPQGHVVPPDREFDAVKPLTEELTGGERHEQVIGKEGSRLQVFDRRTKLARLRGGSGRLIALGFAGGGAEETTHGFATSKRPGARF